MTPEQLVKLLKLKEAIKNGDGEFILLGKIEALEQKIENIKPTDLIPLTERLDKISEKVNEPIEIELQIV